MAASIKLRLDFTESLILDEPTTPSTSDIGPSARPTAERAKSGHGWPTNSGTPSTEPAPCTPEQNG